MTEFEGVVPALADALSKRGYLELTPVQKAVLAPEFSGKDALVSAQTGSGKTVAFGLALAPTLLDGADRFARARAPLALAVAPTRELALQVTRELEWLYANTGAIIASCVGGMDMRTERRNLARGAHIVVGTPGRLRDHIQRNSLNVSELKAVVLDEADEMLDLGFRDDLEFILEATPDERRTLMFSATVPRSIGNLAKKYQHDAVRLKTSEEQKQHLDIEYRALTVSSNERENAIINVLRFYEAKNALVFCSTRATVNRMTARFNNRGFSVVALSGELSQNERTHALQAMRDGRARVCIATDVAARGIDLPNLELVIHADLPTNRESLLHRSGRTGRAGRKGVSVLIVPHNGRRRTERLLTSASIDASWGKPPSADDILRRDDERLLADPVLIEAVKDEEKSFIQEILAKHSTEQVAAAFVRMYRAGQSAPEELLDLPPKESKKRQREEFGESVWISLSVGRKQNAEPRWLLPLLCGAGQLTKRDVGAITMQPDETYVQLAAGCADRFMEAIGPNKTLEKNIRVKRLERKPDMDSGPQGNTYAGRQSHSERKSGPSSRAKPKRNFSAEPTNFFGGEGDAEKSEKKKPRDKSKNKGKNKNVGKPKFGKTGAKHHKTGGGPGGGAGGGKPGTKSGTKSGASPFKKKKPKKKTD